MAAATEEAGGDKLKFIVTSIEDYTFKLEAHLPSTSGKKEERLAYYIGASDTGWRVRIAGGDRLAYCGPKFK